MKSNNSRKEYIMYELSCEEMVSVTGGGIKTHVLPIEPSSIPRVSWFDSVWYGVSRNHPAMTGGTKYGAEAGMTPLPSASVSKTVDCGACHKPSGDGRYNFN